MDLELIEKLIAYIHDSRGGDIGPNQPGAVLVFLPGWDEINRLKERLQAHRVFGDARRALVLPLHSMVPSADQKRVFLRAPTGVRKASEPSRAAAGAAPAIYSRPAALPLRVRVLRKRLC